MTVNVLGTVRSSSTVRQGTNGRVWVRLFLLPEERRNSQAINMGNSFRQSIDPMRNRASQYPSGFIICRTMSSGTGAYALGSIVHLARPCVRLRTLSE